MTRSFLHLYLDHSSSSQTTPRVLDHWNSFITPCPTPSCQFFIAALWTLPAPASQTWLRDRISSTSPTRCSSHSQHTAGSPTPPPPERSIQLQLLSTSAEDNLHPNRRAHSFKKKVHCWLSLVFSFSKTGSLASSASSPCIHPASWVTYCQAAKHCKRKVTEPWQQGRLKSPI